MTSGVKTDLTLRLASETDADVIHDLICAMAGEMGRAEEVTSRPSDYLKHGFKSQADFNVVLAERSGKAVGLCLFLYTFSSWRGRRGVYIQDIFVRQTERGMGLAAHLLKETARIAHEEGATFVRLSVDKSNADARAFYHRLGLKHSESECIYMALDGEFDNIRSADQS